MTKTTGSYDDQLARFYDVMYASIDEDTKFYVEEAKRNKAPALEIGCGTGRILIEAAKAGLSLFSTP